MPTLPRQSIVFHPAATIVLAVSAAFATYLLFMFIIPALHVETHPGAINVWFMSEYTLAFLMFFASAGIVLAILARRAWLHHVSRNASKSNAA